MIKIPSQIILDYGQEKIDMVFNCPKCQKIYRIGQNLIINQQQIKIRCKQCHLEFWITPPIINDKNNEQFQADPQSVTQQTDNEKTNTSPILIYSDNTHELNRINAILKAHHINALCYSSSTESETESDSDSEPTPEFESEPTPKDESESESEPIPESKPNRVIDSISDLDQELTPHSSSDYQISNQSFVSSTCLDHSIQAHTHDRMRQTNATPLFSYTKGVLSLDVGTSHIVLSGYDNDQKQLPVIKVLNAFFTVPESEVTKKILKEKNVLFYSQNHLIYVIGDSAQAFANIFNSNLRKPMEKGFISPHEKEGFHVVEAILDSILPSPNAPGHDLICYGIPGTPASDPEAVIYHETVLHRFLERYGFNPIAVDEALATVMAELIHDDYTGIGISFGGGMCNVCFAYLSVPVLTFSIQKGGDYIDTMAGKAVGEHANTIKQIKENELILCRASDNRILTALNIYYEDLIKTLLETLHKMIEQSNRIPVLSKAIPIVLSGGTAKPNGFKDLFESIMTHMKLPLAISEVRVANDPLNTTVKGLLEIALSMKESYDQSNHYLLR
nr:magnetosome protein Mad28-2 [Desulfobacteraceae bacterium]